MFKKSDEQEWTRFRGALSRDRDETGAAPAVPDTSDPTIGSTSGLPVAGQGTDAGSSVRSPNDVSVGLSSARSRGFDGEVESLIGEHTSFEGTLKTEGSVRLLGSIQGEIESKSTIIVEEKARVTARLTAQQVTVAGQLDGQIFCEGRVEIRPTGRVTGEINAGALIVQEGAYFDGNSRMASGGAHAPSGSAAGGSSGASSSAGGGSGASSAGGGSSGQASGGFANRMAAEAAANARPQ
jgi:cytoskeletal protein CcmA (bactofilin family)